MTQRDRRVKPHRAPCRSVAGEHGRTESEAAESRCGRAPLSAVFQASRPSTIFVAMGLGRGSIVDLPVDANGRLAVETLRAALAASPASPTIVLLQAGDLNIGP